MLTFCFVDEQLLQSIQDIFIAGTDTTVTALRCFVLFMLNRQDIQNRMRYEIKNIVSDSRSPSYRDRIQLPFCEAVIHETLRVANIAPLAIPHGLRRDLHFRGYTIPKDALILISLDSILNDPDTFEEPHIFNPDRFIKDGILSGANKVYAFGIGKCIAIFCELWKYDYHVYILTYDKTI